MNKKLLGLTPKRYLCPYCGEWHDWELSHILGYYDSPARKAKLKCEKQLYGCRPREMQVYFSSRYCYYRTIPTCSIGNLDINDKIPIEGIFECSTEPRVKFSVPFIADNDVGGSNCSDCDSKDRCLMCKLGEANHTRHMYIKFGFEFEQSDYKKFSNEAILAHKEKKLQEREDAATSEKQVSQQPQIKENKEDTTMANNFFNMNMEFGPNTDENIVSTLMGVAVKNGNTWRIYNKNKKEITDLGDVQLGNLPIFILPTTQLSEGDLIKDAGEYYFVTKVATPKTPTQTLSARTGEMKSIVPIKNILGFSCYSKVIALSDSLNVSDDFDVEKLAIMSAMFDQTGETGGQMNQLFPLMLFKDKFGGDDDTIKLMLMYSMMSSEGSGGQTNQVLPLMLLNDKLGGDDDTIKLMLMSSMMPSEGNGGQTNQVLPLMLFNDKLGGDDGIRNFILVSSMMDGNQAGSNNQMMNYLMLDLFMSKKDEKATKADDGVAK